MAETALQVTTSPAGAVGWQGEALVLPVFAGEVLHGGAAEVDAALDGLVSDMLARGEWRSERGEAMLLPTFGRIGAGRVLLVGLGDRAEFDLPAWARSVSSGCRALARRGLTGAALSLPHAELSLPDLARAAVEGAESARFIADPYRGGPRREKLLAVLNLLTGEDVASAARAGSIRGAARNLARELTNEPGNVITPTTLAQRAAGAAEATGIECEVLERDRLAALGMTGILNVARGSAEPPCMIVLRHLPRPGAPALALVGKAVTFDTGGISLKPRENMHRMKGDMAGGAAVIGAMQAIGQLGIGVNVVGIIPAADNMPDGLAWKPGDVVTMRNGKTVEVISTDAEGRMLLADALSYAQEIDAARLVDIATLTGACVVALGHVASGLFGTDAELVEQVRLCGMLAGERHWPMPLFREYRSLNRSEIADLKNSAGRSAGSIGAAWFLREFVDDRPWVHLDVAGTSWLEKPADHAPAGPTGTGVGTFIELARHLAGA